jgi:hypothetical protein
VTTNIRPGGDRISLHYLGQDKSEKARKEIEVKYKLTKAEERARQKPDLKADPKVIEYGKSETKRAITNILGQTLRTYKFTSLPELNAVLRQYHILADRGSKDSRMYANGGLVYWITNEKAEKLGVPIKASSIYGKPTLTTLAEKFKLNETLRKPHKAALTTKIAEALNQRSRNDFQQFLHNKGVEVIFRQNEDGRLYGVTYIDQKTKCVFNGSDLGKEFSANALAVRFREANTKPAELQPIHQTFARDSHLAEDIAGILMGSDQNDMAAYNQIKRGQRKKQKRQNI